MQWLNQLCPFCENRKERLKNEDLYTWLVVVGVAVVHLEAQAAVDAGLWSTRVQVDENLGVAQSSTTTVTRHLKQVTLSYLLPIISRVFLPCKGLWIRNHFLRIRIQQFFSMRIRIQLHFKCGSGLDPDPASKTMWKKQKVAQVNTNGACANLSNLMLSSWIRILKADPVPDQAGKMNADPDPQPYNFFRDNEVDI